MLSSNKFVKYRLDNTYSKESQIRSQTRLEVYFQELMEVTCHPDRYFKWCLDDEDKIFVS